MTLAQFFKPVAIAPTDESNYNYQIYNGMTSGRSISGDIGTAASGAINFAGEAVATTAQGFAGGFFSNLGVNGVMGLVIIGGLAYLVLR